MPNKCVGLGTNVVMEKQNLYSQTLVPALVFIKSSDESLKIKTKQVNTCKDNNHLTI